MEFEAALLSNATLFMSVDAAFPGLIVDGDIAATCRQLAPRGIQMGDRSSAVVVYEAPQEAYVQYVRDLYDGNIPTVIVPDQPYDDSDLSLVGQVAGSDNALLEVSKRCFILPFMAQPEVFEIGARTGSAVLGGLEEWVHAGGHVHANHKVLFQELARKLGIDLPPTVYAQGWESVVDKAIAVYERDGGVVLRRAMGAGGLGTLLIKPGKDLGGSLENFLIEQCLPVEAWHSETVLVEPCLQLESSPSVVMYIDERGTVHVWAVVDQRVVGNGFVGMQFPSSLPNSGLKQTLVAKAHAYASERARQGARGWINVEFGVMPDGSYVAFESNCRMVATVHPLLIAARLRGDKQVGAVLSNDKVLVRPDLTFGEIYRSLDGLHLRLGGGAGVVVTIPPVQIGKKASIGIVVHGGDTEEADAVFAEALARLQVA